MSASWFLLAAEAGMSLFQARSSMSAAGRAAGSEMAAATMSGEMERFQMQMRGREEARLRQGQLRETLATQQAAMSGRGIVGGRTAALVGATSRTAAMREQSYSDVQQRMGMTASQYRQQQSVAASQAGLRGETQSAMFGLAGSAIDIGRRGVRLWEAGQAKKAGLN